MKNKIKGFAKGNFQMERPEITFSETHIMIVAGEGELYQGSFVIQNAKDGDIRGLIYSSSFRVHFINQGFEGNPVELKFVYDTTGMRPGQVESGKFTVVCNGGEYELSFTALIEKPYIQSAHGKVQSVHDLKKLAAQDFEEALRIFRMRQFTEILKYEDERIKNLYLNIRKWALDAQALEEFLVGVKQKEKIFLTLSEEHVSMENVLDDLSMQLEIQKNTWGYAKIKIHSDSEFLVPEVEELTTENFVGNNYQLHYRILTECLHQGKNYGILYVETAYETLKVEVVVHQTCPQRENFGNEGLIAGQGLKAYLAYIGGRIDLPTWGKQVLDIIGQLQTEAPDNLYYTFLTAHIYIQLGQEDKASWILEHSEYSRQAVGKKTELHAYYIFLQALLRKEPSYTNKVAEEITRLFMKNLYSWPLLCMLVQLDAKYKDPVEKIRVYERQFSNGANHVLMYADAYLCYSDNVLLLRKLGAFEIQIMDFASKYKIISKELALYFADLVLQQKKYDQRFLRILTRAYAMYQEPLILQAICNQLINGNHTDKKSFAWYERAVDAELKIAQLYEYYMMSVDEEYLKKPFPKQVYLYFVHGSTLDYRRTALLYASVLTHEPDESPLLKQYMDAMKEFTWQQLRARHVSKPLRILYKRFVKEENLDAETIEALYDICHAYRVYTEREDMKYVIVIEKDGSVRQRVPHRADGAIVYLYNKETRIVWESKDGVHYTDSIPYDTIRLFYESSFMSLCRKYRMEKENIRRENERPKLSFENLKRYGIDAFDEQEVFLLCSRYLREEEVAADDYLIYLCFELIKRGLYDKVLITYMCQYYCGATKDMKLVWNKAREYGVRAHALAERIITQMLYSEVMFAEEAIFEDYCKGKAYFRLKQACFAFLSREYIVRDRQLGEGIVKLMLQDIREGESLADICKVAALKFYANRSCQSELMDMLHDFMQECCNKGLVFDFYMSYPKEWLRQLKLHDKVIVSYRGDLPEARVHLQYRIQQGEAGNLDWKSEILLPTFENIYVKSFVVYADETLFYRFEEEQIQQMAGRTDTVGVFGRINQLTELEPGDRLTAMKQLEMEVEIAEAMFPVA